MTEVLRVADVWVAFERGRDRVSVLEGTSLSVDAGEVVAVVASAGQGKTTVVRLASGTLRPDRGAVRIAGIELSRLKDKQLARVLASDVGVVTGNGPGLNMTAREYVEMAAAAPKDGWHRRWRRRDRRRMTTSVLDRFDIAGCAELRWDELSDWQRVLVELAQAVVVRPRLLLLDNVADRFGLRQKQVLANLLEAWTVENECGALMAVTDYGAAARAVRVWRLHCCQLELMADHTDAELQPNGGGDVLPLRPVADPDERREARRNDA